MDNEADIRWEQRFSNYLKALAKFELKKIMELIKTGIFMMMIF